MKKTLPSAFILILVACSWFNPEEQFTPSGTSFTLSPDITLAGIDGEGPGYDPNGVFQLGLTARSNTDTTTCDTLIAGLFLVPESDAVQNIILLKPRVLLVGPADTTYTIGGFCCNGSLDAPEAGNRFDLGPVTDNSLFRQLIGLVSDKDITYGGFVVQEAVWDITDNNRLSQTYIDEINQLPPDTSRAPTPTPDPPVRPLKRNR